MYKVYIKKDIEVRGVEYTKDESYEVSQKIYRILIFNDALGKPKKKSKKKIESSDDLNIS
jgi:hypothetical protein